MIWPLLFLTRSVLHSPRLYSSTTLSMTKILALHGSGGTAKSFQEQVVATFPDATISVVQGHVEKDGGYAWWKLRPGERSFTATEYPGFDVSKDKVLTAMQNCDVVLAHSQGAILVAALLACNEYPCNRYILNGVAWPNPFAKQMEHVQLQDCSVLVISGRQDRINPPEQANQVASALQKGGASTCILPHDAGHAVPWDNPQVMAEVKTWMEQ